MSHRRQILKAIGCLSLLPVIGRSAERGGAIGAEDPRVASFVQETGFNGVVLMGQAGARRYARAFGRAFIEEARPATLGTRYAIASISKWLTAVAVMRLVEQGRLALDQPIGRYLSGYRPDTAGRLTLRHLLSNTSGVPNDFIAAVKADPQVLQLDLTTEQALHRFCEGDLAFEPGSRFDYALTNWIIVTAIVEAVTGRPFQQVMREVVLSPLEMHATGAEADIDKEPETAASYRSVEPPVPWPNARRPYLAASGGYFSTADDLLVAAHRVFDSGFLGADALSELTKVQDASEAYALGGRVRMMDRDGHTLRVAWETGNTAGYRSLLAHCLDDQTTIVLLNNTGLRQSVLNEFAEQLLIAPSPRAQARDRPAARVVERPLPATRA